MIETLPVQQTASTQNAPLGGTVPPVSIRRAGDVAVISIDAPPVNALSGAVRRGLLEALANVAADTSIRAAVLWGGEDRFLAGADIREMEAPPDEPSLPRVVAAIDAMTKPIAAAIGGAALGGGFEVALACDLRLGSPKALIGLPETKLGVIPGSGGTQRLPRLIGTAEAIAAITSGRLFKAVEAKAAGLLDDVTGNVLEAAIASAPSAAKRRVAALPLAPAAEADAGAVEAALKMSRNAPAAEGAIAAILAGRDGGFDAGLATEREIFLRLRGSPEAAALRHLFRAERRASKAPDLQDVMPRPVRSVSVIGAGTMGVGIAAALADAGLSVALLERHEAASQAGQDRLQAIYDGQVAKRRIDESTRAYRLGLVKSGTDWSVLGEADLVIEAAFEDLAVKRDIFSRLDSLTKPGAILASNTSYLDLSAIAAATSRPQDVIGLHFFAPANVMRLVEVVRTPETAPDAVRTGLDFAKRIGKQPVLAKASEGFIGNRIYAAYRRHAEYILEDGATPQAIDEALEAFGFAMGVFAVSDMSGLDIAWAMRKRLAPARDPRQRYIDIADRLCEIGHLGRKTGNGFYDYASGQRRPSETAAYFIAEARRRHGIEPRAFAAAGIQRRLMAVMANEGAKLLEEGVAARASDIDVTFVTGYGYPRFRGGPMWAADQEGLANVLAEAERAAEAGGAGSEPAPLLVELARRGGTFAGWDAGRG
ncbi:MAG: 3-hydroxyacyl-CoA dehydrogenase NAD-binding domain-containing protein [Beijerinckiaceae bacterium]|nr:3-hydroxyacyl-CoA dehydrogenase NAD-binding domain-containing protein [Beijerinckiaceae bacterium]